MIIQWLPQCYWDNSSLTSVTNCLVGNSVGKLSSSKFVSWSIERGFLPSPGAIDIILLASIDKSERCIQVSNWTFCDSSLVFGTISSSSCSLSDEEPVPSFSSLSLLIWSSHYVILQVNSFQASMPSSAESNSHDWFRVSFSLSLLFALSHCSACNILCGLTFWKE